MPICQRREGSKRSPAQRIPIIARELRAQTASRAVELTRGDGRGATERLGSLEEAFAGDAASPVFVLAEAAHSSHERTLATLQEQGEAGIAQVRARPTSCQCTLTATLFSLLQTPSSEAATSKQLHQ